MIRKPTAIILCGGKGERFGEGGSHKALSITGGGVPVLWYAIRNAMLCDRIENVFIMTSSDNDSDTNECIKNSVPPTKNIATIISQNGIGQAIVDAWARFKNLDGYIIINGDTYNELSLSKFASDIKPNNILFSASLKKIKIDYGVIAENPLLSGTVLSFDEKPEHEFLAWSGYVYIPFQVVADMHNLHNIYNTYSSNTIESMTKRHLTYEKPVYYCEQSEYWLDIGTKERLRELNEWLLQVRR